MQLALASVISFVLLGAGFATCAARGSEVDNPQRGALRRSGLGVAAHLRSVDNTPEEPQPAEVVEPPVQEARSPWDVELLIAAQPDQTIDVACNRRVDCLTPVKASFGGLLRLGFRQPAVWGLGLSLGLVHANDQEQIPVAGYSILTMRLDLDLEFGRTEERFGAALRISPILAHAWHTDGSTWRTDIPGFTFILGRTDLWGEVGVPPLPTPADPRLFHLGVGWTHARISGVAGVGTFGTLGYQRDALDRIGSKLGLFAHLEAPLTDRFRITLRLHVTTPVSVALGFATYLGRPSQEAK